MSAELDNATVILAEMAEAQRALGITRGADAIRTVLAALAARGQLIATKIDEEQRARCALNEARAEIARLGRTWRLERGIAVKIPDAEMHKVAAAISAHLREIGAESLEITRRGSWGRSWPSTAPEVGGAMSEEIQFRRPYFRVLTVLNDGLIRVRTSYGEQLWSLRALRQTRHDRVCFLTGKPVAPGELAWGPVGNGLNRYHRVAASALRN